MAEEKADGGTDIKSLLLAAVPLVMLISFAFSYSLSQKFFVTCAYTGVINCQAIDSTQVFIVSPPPDLSTPGSAEDLKGREIMAKRYSSRFIWTFLTAASMLFCLIASCFFGRIVVKWFEKWWAVVLMIAISTIVGFIVAFSDTLPIARPLIENTIESGAGGLKNVIAIGSTVNGLIYSIAIVLVLGMCAILLRTSPRNIELKVLSHGMNHLRIILYISTILLVLGVFKVSTVYSWALTFVTSETAKTAEGFFSNVTTVMGAYFTLLLAATYLPAAYIINWRARKVYEEANPAVPKTDEDAELQEMGLKFSFVESLPKILAIAAPLLTSPIAALFTKVGSAGP